MRRLRRRILLAGLLVAVLAVLYAQWSARPPTEALPALAADLAQTSVSGLSAGAYMAGQMQMAHSSAIMGAGLVAGGPYACAESPTARLLPWPASVPQNLARALARCMGGADAVGVPDVDRLLERARSFAAAGAIDPLAGLAVTRVYLFWGGADRTVGRPVVEAARAFYAAAGVPEAQIAFLENAAAGHAFLTEEVGNPCGATSSPWLNDCDYDQAGAILAHIYGSLAPPPPEPPSTDPLGRLTRFDQRPFLRGLSNSGLDDYGYVYVPQSCRAAAGCRVHVVFHGCEQGRDAIGDRFVRNAGFARHAGANRLVILYPQVAPSAANPKGCWDWWGYTARDYLTKDAPQIAAVWRMVERLAANP